MKYISLVALFFLAGCIGVGVKEMTPEQIKATEGMATCTTIHTAYGRGVSTTVNVDDVKRASTNKGKITISPDCAVTIETDVRAK